MKPLIAMRDGEPVQAGIARSRSKATERLYELAKGASDIQDLAIVHSTTSGEAALLRDRTCSVFAKERILMAGLGSALGVHAGPGVLIVALSEGGD